MSAELHPQYGNSKLSLRFEEDLAPVRTNPASTWLLDAQRTRSATAARSAPAPGGRGEDEPEAVDRRVLLSQVLQRWPGELAPIEVGVPSFHSPEMHRLMSHPNGDVDVVDSARSRLSVAAIRYRCSRSTTSAGVVRGRRRGVHEHRPGVSSQVGTPVCSRAASADVPQASGMRTAAAARPSGVRGRWENMA